MATLPDLDTSQVGMVAYWNALNHGVSDIDPEDVLTDGNIISYTLYDNGITAEYSLPAVGRNATVRVKEDGWFVVYTDRTENYKTSVGSHISGPWDIINDWTSTSGYDIQKNTLERSVNSLYNELSNSGNITYNTSDVGLYSYKYSSASTITTLGASFHDNYYGSTSFSYTSETDRHHHSVTAWCNMNDNISTTVSFEGYTLIDEAVGSTPDDTTYQGTLDVLGKGAAPDPGTNYSASIDTGAYGYVGQTTFSLWS